MAAPKTPTLHHFLCFCWEEEVARQTPQQIGLILIPAKYLIFVTCVLPFIFVLIYEPKQTIGRLKVCSVLVFLMREEDCRTGNAI
ncbi:hypothetical protein B5X24_HaOG214474 [Helicoverpa armigera]|nr:hypothetical protein B5X24_HaOG214474 [Helicoverpa armigera]